MDAVATAAKASKATLYRRWATKAELVVDAMDAREGRTARTQDATPAPCAATCIAVGVRPRAASPTSVHWPCSASVITALHRDREFAEAFHERFLRPRSPQSRDDLRAGAGAGRDPADVDLELLAPALAAIILHRAFVLGSRSTTRSSSASSTRSSSRRPPGPPATLTATTRPTAKESDVDSRRRRPDATRPSTAIATSASPSSSSPSRS